MVFNLNCTDCEFIEDCMKLVEIEDSYRRDQGVKITQSGVLIRSAGYPVHVYRNAHDVRTGDPGKTLPLSAQGTNWLNHKDYNYFRIGREMYVSKGEDIHEIKIFRPPICNFSIALILEFARQIRQKRFLREPREKMRKFLMH